jgi:hypothetical protein
MPRTRDVIVPNAVKGIDEVVVKRTNTTRGTLTSQKVVPVVLPTIQKGESSRMKKKKGSELQDQSSKDNQSEMAIHTDTANDTQAQFLGEHEYDFTEHVAEEHHPQVTVCIRVNLHGNAF